jgi:glycine dehydrogenase subunit 2
MDRASDSPAAVSAAAKVAIGRTAEPTETETRETLDHFCARMSQIAREAEESPELVKDAPHVTPVGRLDEAQAARRPDLAYRRCG